MNDGYPFINDETCEFLVDLYLIKDTKVEMRVSPFMLPVGSRFEHQSGTYEVWLASYDNHSDKKKIQPQFYEQFRLIFLNGAYQNPTDPLLLAGTGYTPDLPEDQDLLITKVEDTMVIPAGVTHVYAEHKCLDDEACPPLAESNFKRTAESIDPICAKLVRIGDAPRIGGRDQVAVPLAENNEPAPTERTFDVDSEELELGLGKPPKERAYRITVTVRNTEYLRSNNFFVGVNNKFLVDENGEKEQVLFSKVLSILPRLQSQRTVSYLVNNLASIDEINIVPKEGELDVESIEIRDAQTGEAVFEQRDRKTVSRKGTSSVRIRE